MYKATSRVLVLKPIYKEKTVSSLHLHMSLKYNTNIHSLSIALCDGETFAEIPIPVANGQTGKTNEDALHNAH